MSIRWNGAEEEQERKVRKLTIVKGQELELHASNRILDSEEFMYAAYGQAKEALVEIVRHTERFKERRECRKGGQDDLEMELFQYSGNVIAFVGQRGAGKTQTMLSFSQSLACPEVKFDSDPDLKNCRFFVMPPISPSALQKSTEFLHVVLSRFYRYVTRALEKDSGCMREDPGLRTELWRYFNRCVSGINGLSGEGKAADISELQNTVDGLALRESFYHLVSLTVDRVLQKDCGKNAFLVLQLDDADSQIENGYQVLEDVRRYLLIPNLVILMSSDMEMFHNVVMQNHMSQFPDLVKEKVLSADALSRTCRKYIDKLIPPSHMVHLPRLEQYTDLGGADIELYYTDGKNNPALPWAAGMPSQKLQDIVLAMIYKKTGIIFVNQDPWLNHIIPRSLRGLNQFLYLLSEMEDVPELSLDSWASPPDVAWAVLDQYPTAAQNLERFGNYFFYDWINVKIEDKEDRLFLRRLVNAPRVSFVPEVLKYLQKKYAGTEKLKEISGSQWTLYDLDRVVFQWKSDQALSLEEDLLFFVIGTIRTIRGHMAAWKIKRDTAEKWLAKEDLGYNRLFACDYNPEQWQITAGYPLQGLEDKLHLQQLQMGSTCDDHPIYLVTSGPAAGKIVDDWNRYAFPSNQPPMDKKGRKDLQELCSGVFGLHDPRRRYLIRIHLLQFITLFLRLAGMIKASPLSEQKLVYMAQEYALRVALNWDVTEKVCQEISAGILKEDFGFSNAEGAFVNNLTILFRRIDGALEGMNGGTLDIFWKQGSGGNYSFEYLIQELFKADGNLGNLSTYMRQERYVFHKEGLPQQDESQGQANNGDADIEPSTSSDTEGNDSQDISGKMNDTVHFLTPLKKSPDPDPPEKE